jgi:tRNA-splicing ligase RtcB
MKDPRLIRIDDTRLKVLNDQGVDTVLFANEEVPVETAAVDELVSVVGLQDTVERLAEADASFFETAPALVKIAATPDFHKGAGIPIGTVMATRGYIVPQAIGNDINCGMRLHITSLQAHQVMGKLDVLESRARHLYFEGGRNIPMSNVQREAMLREGLPGLLNATPRAQTEGLWALFHESDLERDLDRVHNYGSMTGTRVSDGEGTIGPAEGLNRDTQIGSIGGGNHFVEIQRVAKILDGTTARAWGLKEGLVTVMVHSGSLGVGHACGGSAAEILREVYPRGVAYPANGIFVLPSGERYRHQLQRFRHTMNNAANFAFANRMFLGLMAVASLRDTCGPFGCGLLYDAPHNLVWEEQLDGQPLFLHRKGACPARGYDKMANTPFAFYGEPVLVPGSMGSSSFILAGRGCDEALWSASHGAGRALSRGEAMHGHEQAFEEFMKAFRVVTPVDLRRPDIRMRRDIMEKKLADIKQEAPFAYKGIGPVIKTLTEAGMAIPVAELTPLMTIKG